MLFIMSQMEFSRLTVLQDLTAGRLEPGQAAQILNLSRRQVFRLKRRFESAGAPGLISLKRGRPSNRKTPPAFREHILQIIREEYPDFGPTLAVEKLKERNGVTVSKETLRNWMVADGIWLNRKARRKAVHQPRYRRECSGELVQIDGSEHWWFEDRGPQCTLLVYIDDATSQLMHLKFVQSESTFSYFDATIEYLQKHGKPVAFYSDKHGVFRVNAKGAVSGDGMTQFGRALHELNIDILCANTPQAKGRVERANKTLQDRLVKELRLQRISTIDSANSMLPAFIEDYNRRFGKEPMNPKNLHRLIRADEDLREAFVWCEERTVSSSLTLQYDKMVFILEPNDVSRDLARKRVMVRDYPDGRLTITYKGLSLPYRQFDKARHVDQGAITDNKRLGAMLATIQIAQQQNGIFRSQHAPRRTDQSESIFNRSTTSISVLKKRRRTIKTRKANSADVIKIKRPTAAPLIPPVMASTSTAAEGPVQRLPFGFSPDNSLSNLDLETQILLREMDLRNQQADLERKELNRRRYQSRRKYLRALAEPSQHDEAA